MFTPDITVMGIFRVIIFALLIAPACVPGKRGERQAIDFDCKQDTCSIGSGWFNRLIMYADSGSMRQDGPDTTISQLLSLMRNCCSDAEMKDKIAHLIINDTSYGYYLSSLSLNLDDDNEDEIVMILGDPGKGEYMLLEFNPAGHRCMVFPRHGFESQYADPKLKLITFKDGTEKAAELSGIGFGGSGFYEKKHDVYLTNPGFGKPAISFSDFFNANGPMKARVRQEITAFEKNGTEIHFSINIFFSMEMNGGFTSESVSPQDSMAWNNAPHMNFFYMLNDSAELTFRIKPGENIELLPGKSGLSYEQYEALQKPNTTEDYARRLYHAFKKEIHDKKLPPETISWLDIRWKE